MSSLSLGSDYSYGYRPQRNTLQAVQKSLNYINSGYRHIVEIDLKGFFDEVDHCLLLYLLYRKIKCPITMQLIRRWLREGLGFVRYADDCVPRSFTKDESLASRSRCTGIGFKPP